jgi:mono/diheme cytochrome c family protein
MSKRIFQSGLVVFFSLLFIWNLSSCGEEAMASGPVDAQSIFIKRCATCHGSEGNLQLSGAKNITVSQLSADEIKNQIIHGKAGMPPFESMLTVQEIDALTAYCMKLSGR